MLSCNIHVGYKFIYHQHYAVQIVMALLNTLLNECNHKDGEEHQAKRLSPTVYATEHHSLNVSLLMEIVLHCEKRENMFIYKAYFK